MARTTKGRRGARSKPTPPTAKHEPRLSQGPAPPRQSRPRRDTLDAGSLPAAIEARGLTLPAGVFERLARTMWRWVRDAADKAATVRREASALSTGSIALYKRAIKLGLGLTAVPEAKPNIVAADAIARIRDEFQANVWETVVKISEASGAPARGPTVVNAWPGRREAESIYVVLASPYFSDRLIARTLYPRLPEAPALQRIYKHRSRGKKSGRLSNVLRDAFKMRWSQALDEL